MPDATAPGSVAAALTQLDSVLGFLATADWAALPVTAQRDAVAGFERAEARQVAARTAVLAAFDAGNGYRLDGHAGAVPWLSGIMRLTRAAAKDQARWVKRLGGHPVIAAALAGAAISPSWGAQFAAWNNRLPVEDRADADGILISAAAAGLPLEDIARLAQEIFERSANAPDDDGDGRFRDRGVRLERTFGGAGKLTGDLSPECAGLVQKIFDALGKRIPGGEDLRGEEERNHDALMDACRRLLKAGLLPQSSGMDTKATVIIPLSELRTMPGASALEAAWIEARAGEPGMVAGRGAAGAACGAELTPVVTGSVDHQALDRLTDLWLEANGLTHGAREACACTCGKCTCRRPAPLTPEARAQIRATLLRLAVDAVSGPGGLAGFLRAQVLGAPFNTASMPLDIGYSKDIPDHIRRAVINRDKHCAWPGCDKPPAACEPHHLTPRHLGGRTELSNLKLFCWFHHHICIHRIGWTVTVSPDGSVHALAPWGDILRSHGPPAARAA